jgi:Dolichyl-phosphate-mannose-protein mannosyltransferase
MTSLKFVKYLPDKKIIFFITLFACILIRYLVADIAFERDEGEYAYAGTTILDGGLPYKDVYNMKLPGVYYSYAVIMHFLGRSVFGVRIGLLIINLLNTFLLFLVAKKIFNKDVAWYSATAFLVMSMSFYALGITANAEHFLILFMLAGLVSLLEGTYFTVCVAGFFYSFALMMKQHAIFFVLFAILWLLVDAVSASKIHSIKDRFLIFLKKSMIFCFSFSIPLMLLCYYMVSKGIFEQFYFLTVKYASAYVSVEKFNLWGLKHFDMIFKDNLGYWLICFVTLFWILRGGFLKYKVAKNFNSILSKNEFYLLTFWLLSFFSIIPGYYFRPHYFLLLSPASALLVGYGLVYRIKDRIVARLLNTVSVISALVVPLLFFKILQPKTITVQIYNSNDIFEPIRDICLDIINLKKNKGSLGMLSFEPQIFFYTQMKSASGYMYEYPMSENQPYAMSMAEQFISEIKVAKPDLLWYQPVFDHDIVSEKYVLTEWLKIQNEHYRPIIKVYRKYTEPVEQDTTIFGDSHLGGDWRELFIVSERKN